MSVSVHCMSLYPLFPLHLLIEEREQVTALWLKALEPLRDVLVTRAVASLVSPVYHACYLKTP